jgi:hypothetical protein
VGPANEANWPARRHVRVILLDIEVESSVIADQSMIAKGFLAW